MVSDQVRTFPHGVPCWVDVALPDLDAGSAFYAGLFGWTFTDAMPPDAPGRYLIAQLDGHDAAAIASQDDETPPSWQTYVAVDDVDATTAELAELGASVAAEPTDAGPGGRTSTIIDTVGAPLRLWQARNRPGVQVANAPGSWNFSNLHTADAAAAQMLFEPTLGWRLGTSGFGTSISVPGYGDHLEATVDPEIRTRQAQAPAGFADVVGAITPLADDEEPHWHVVFTVSDRDAAASLAETLGATVLRSSEDGWTRRATVRDPQGAVLTISQFTPPSW